MTRRQRVMATLRGEPVDRRGAGALAREESAVNGSEQSAGGAETAATTAGQGLVSLVGEEPADRRDAIFFDLSASGELLVARVRILLVCLLLLIQFTPGTDVNSRRVTLPLNVVALAVAVLFHFLASRRPWAWLEGFASSAADVTLVSCGLASFLVLDQPHIAVNSWTLFEVYFLAIGCASLRYNPQACALTGLLAVAQYGMIVVYAASRWDLNAARYAPFKYGMFDWHVQGLRLLLLGSAALVSAFVVLRAQGLRRLSGTDRLTGIANRGAFDERLAEEADRARRYSRPFAVALVDVDDFKRINDAGGHPGGDAVLRAVATILGRSTRKSDLVARFGGDEFALLLRETTAELVMARLEALRQVVAGAHITAGDRTAAGPVRVTLSIGVAGWPEDGARVEDVLAVADARLYDAKQGGRNRIVGPPPRELPRTGDGPGPLPPE